MPSGLEAMVAGIAQRAAEAVMRDTRARYVSQHTSEALIGLPPRNFLEWVRSSDFPLPVVRHGKTRLVEVEPMLAYLRSLAVVPGAESDATQPKIADAADQVLADVFGPEALRRG